jgi:hypothetical protein
MMDMIWFAIKFWAATFALYICGSLIIGVCLAVAEVFKNDSV